MSKNKIQWVDSLKFIAALSVFWGHFYTSFYLTIGTRVLGNMSRYMMFLCNHVIKLFVDGNFWVFVFCLISGYFAVRKRIETVWDLVKAIAQRYVRFVIPVTCANLLALFIQETIGYHTTEWQIFSGSVWVGEAYQVHLTLLDVIKSAIILDHRFVGPFWVVQPIFIGTCCIYIYNYLKEVLVASKFEYLPELLVSIGGWITVANSTVYDNFYHLSYLVAGGVLIYSIWENIKIPVELKWLPIINLVMTVLFLNTFPNMGVWEKSLVAVVFVMSIYYINPIKTFIEKKILVKMNHLSFGIFAVHNPILFSFSIVLQLKLCTFFSYDICSVINIVITTLLVLAVASIYNMVVEKLILGKIMRAINGT